ncbi:PKD domain-containing protein [Saccharicrinis carchari]|uniref:PKD domain-containing protein n=1 Tax=Saccharicrinis carchari TaxID=1168039 RepID=A0A521D1U9_SACCC|nr:PKD domain-containing protein [Saccharicrinis carchari]SMO65669.1 PKD domain-containing protein [Saccharicrinis carchari]
MKTFRILGLMLLGMLMVHCGKEDAVAPIADFQFSVDGIEVVFVGVATNASSYSWDFGDGNTSDEQNPTHVYDKPGDYEVTFTAAGDGGADSQTKTITTLPTTEYLLTGGVAASSGKTWLLDFAHSGKDGIGQVKNSLTIDLPLDQDDRLLEWVGLFQGYKDSYTFYHDGKYKVDNADFHGGTLVSMIYANVSGLFNLTPFTEGGDVLGISSQPDLVPLMDLVYSPKQDAVWSINEDDFTVDAINVNDGSAFTETFKGKKQLVLNEYFGFKEYSIVVIIKEITETHLHVAIALHGSQDDPSKPTNLVHLTFYAK